MSEINNDQRIEDIVEMLREVYDPEIPVNIYDLGLVYGVDVVIGRICQQLQDSLCQAVGIRVAKQQAVVSCIDDGWNGTFVGAYDRFFARPRFQKDDSKGLVGRGVRENIAGHEQVGFFSFRKVVDDGNLGLLLWRERADHTVDVGGKGGSGPRHQQVHVGVFFPNPRHRA